jgi:hypothetical protein
MRSSKPKADLSEEQAVYPYSDGQRHADLYAYNMDELESGSFMPAPAALTSANGVYKTGMLGPEEHTVQVLSHNDSIETNGFGR